MTRANVSYGLAGLNFGAAIMNFTFMGVNLYSGDPQGFVNMSWGFVGIVVGMMMISLGNDQYRRGL